MRYLIDDLDRALATDGEDIILRRTIGVAPHQTDIDVKCRAFVRGYGPAELIGLIVQGDSRAIISPTEINRAQWPAGVPPRTSPSDIDPRVPRAASDSVIIQGRLRSVKAAEPIYVGGELVRIEIQVRG